MRIAWFVHGRGKGHAVRTLSALPALHAHDIHLFASGEAAALLRERPELTQVEGCFPGRSMLPSLARRVRADIPRLRALGPDVVISDGDGPSVHAARRLGIPTIAMSHGLVFGHTHLPAGLPKRAVLRERLNAASASLGVSRRIAVHFAELTPRTAGTIVARPDPRAGLARRMGDGTWVAYFRDGGAEDWLERIAKTGQRVRCFGRLARAIPGVTAEATSVEAFARALESAAGVVATAGNHLPAECAALGIPMLALHARGDAEQGMNARLIEAAGLGVRGVLEAPNDGVILRYRASLEATSRPRVSAMPTVSEALCTSLEACRSARPR